MNPNINLEFLQSLPYYVILLIKVPKGLDWATNFHIISTKPVFTSDIQGWLYYGLNPGKLPGKEAFATETFDAVTLSISWRQSYKRNLVIFERVRTLFIYHVIL